VYLYLFLDYGVRYQIGFQDIAAPNMYGIYVLHGFIFQYLILIIFLVGGLLTNVILKFQSHNNPVSLKYYTYNVNLEIFWTIIPALVLLTITLRSFNLLYYMDNIRYADLTVKVIANQWYWTYEYRAYVGGNSN